MKNKKLNNWKVTSVILALLLIVSIFSNGLPFAGFFVKDKYAQNAIDFINENLVEEGEVVLNGIEKESGLYKLDITYMKNEIPAHITKDGKLLILPGMGIIDIGEAEENNPPATPQTPTPTEVPKNDKPEVEIFVMSHCPYGTQIEKGIIPVVELLKNNIDFNLRFVYYAMHGEKEVKEQLNQYCIQKEQEEKLIPYLKCFLGEGNTVACLKDANVDEGKLTKCTEKADKEFDATKNLEDQSSWLSGRFPLFDVDKGLNEKYSVGGSPTLVVNGVIAQSGRDSASLLSAVCAGFSNKPSECSGQLSSEAPGPGFGYSVTGSASSGTCG